MKTVSIKPIFLPLLKESQSPSTRHEHKVKHSVLQERKNDTNSSETSFHNQRSAVNDTVIGKNN